MWILKFDWSSVQLNSGRPRVYVPEAQRLEFGSSSGELNSARPRVNVAEACATLALSARRNTQLLAQALSVIWAKITEKKYKKMNFCKIFQKMRKTLTKNFWNIEVWAEQKHVNRVALVKSFPTDIYLQNLASIQKRTSPVKFAYLAEKSGKGSISNLSTKALPRPCGSVQASGADRGSRRRHSWHSDLRCLRGHRPGMQK